MNKYNGRNTMLQTGLVAAPKQANVQTCSRATLGMSASFNQSNALKMNAISKQNNYLSLTSAAAISGKSYVSNNFAHASRSSNLTMLQSGSNMPKQNIPVPRVPAVKMAPATATTGEKTMITKNIKQADPIPVEGQEGALDVMRKGTLYRYNVPTAEESVVSLCEKELVDYTGHKYCVALNSCGSALFLALKCAGVQPGDKVLTNAFTFTAVPSAIEHAGGKCVYVETDWGLRIDIADLEKKIKSSGAKFLMVSHMRGKICDLDAVKKLCDDNGIYLIEDAAHSLGVFYKGGHTGHHGRISAVSSQSYKMINSGEGGFLLTNDPEVGAAAAVYAGAYEALNAKHITVPGPEYFKGKVT